MSVIRSKTSDKQQLDHPNRRFKFSVCLAKKPNMTMVARVTNSDPRKPEAVIQAIKNGLPIKAYELLKGALKKRDIDMVRLLGVNSRTLTRRKAAARFNIEESDRIVRYAHLQDAAIQLFEGDEDRALQWLDRPLALFGNESPLVHANTEIGASEVVKLIGRLEYGVFS